MMRNVSASSLRQTPRLLLLRRRHVQSSKVNVRVHGPARRKEGRREGGREGRGLSVHEGAKAGKGGREERGDTTIIKQHQD